MSDTAKLIMQILKDFNFKNKQVLVRCDFNVPLLLKKGEGEILDDFRIKQTIPTIEYLIKQGAKIILMSHLGRPEGRELKYSLKLIALRLEKLLNMKIRFVTDCIGEKMKKEVEKLKPSEIILLENLRFYKEEEENDENFAKELSELANIYVNDAFGASHRAHASIVGIPKYLPSGAGFLLEKEIKILTDLIKNPKKPLVAIIGGKKVETKTKLIDKITEIGDFILVGDLIKKEIEERNIQFKYPKKIVKPVMQVSEANAAYSKRLRLSSPLRSANASIATQGNALHFSSSDICEKDINSQTIKLFKEKIALAKTIFWNGPLGMIEEEKFSKGSEEIAKAIIKSNAFSVIGGGETVEFINKLGLAEKFNHLSTGGGAMLEFLSGDSLPGIEALK